MGGASAGRSNASGGTSSSGGNGATGGANGSGGASGASGGNANGGATNGGATNGGTTARGGSPNGGVANGGATTGGKSAGGASSGGKSAGGANSGGASMGGASSGGKSAGGAGNGGAMSGGTGSGGAATGGANTGGKSAGGATSGGAGTGGGSNCPEVNAQLCGMTEQHNIARANVNPAPTTPLPMMTWDTTVAAAAQAWADQCNFSHNTAGYGQNIYASAGGGPPTPAAVVAKSWVSEAQNYSYANNTCNGVCGHYTQVVWRTSTLLGCGIKACSTNSPFDGFPNWYMVVCNYSPAGNVNGARPY